MAGVRPPGGGASRDSRAGRDWRLFEAEVIDDAGRVVWAGAAGSLRLLFLCLVTLVIVCSGCGGLLERGVFVAGLGSGGVHLVVVG
jgi:hypothetical protein